MDRLELKLPATTSYLRLAIGFIKNCAENFGFEGQSALNDIELASEEAIFNVISHACPMEEDSSIVTVRCLKIPSGIEIDIHDKGIPFDPERVDQYDPEKVISGGDAKGLGLFLIRSVMDSVTYRNLGRDGKELQLVKHLDRLPPEGMMRDPGAASGKPSLPHGRKRCDYQVRLFDPGDAVEVSRCAYLMHGYTFYDEDVYYPEALVELHKSGTMTAAVAVTEEGEVALFNALIRQEPDAPIAEMTYVLVNPQIRAPKAMEKVTWFLIDSQRHWLKGVTSSVAASHTLTQGIMTRQGFIPCSMYLCCDAAEWRFHFLKGDAQALNTISSVNFFLSLEAPPRQTLYPPARHREMIEAIYGWLGFEPVWSEPPAEENDGSRQAPAQLESQILEGEMNARITVLEYGRDIVHHINTFVRECRLRDIRFLEIRLPLNRPGTATYTRDLEQLGFFFSGILPRGKHGDYLLLQMPFEWDINYEAIKVSSENGRQILDYVRECEKERHAAS